MDILFAFMRVARFVRSVDFDVFAQCGDMQRVFVSGVGFGFGNGLRRADDFLDVMLMLVFFGNFVGAFVFLVDMLVVLIVLLVLGDFRGGTLIG